MFSRLLTYDSNKLSFTFYAVNYVAETCIMWEYNGSAARVTTTQYVTFLCYLKDRSAVEFFSWKTGKFSTTGKAYLMPMV